MSPFPLMNYFLTLLAVILFVIGLVALTPDDERPGEPPTGLPWQIEVLPDGSPRVFGITLGRSTLGEAGERLGRDRELAIIAAPDEPGALEMYYGHYSAGGITGKLILVADLTPAVLLELRERALQDGGTRRYYLDTGDLPIAYRAPVKLITFLPSIDLDADAVRHRFGQPEETIESSAQLQHLLYPDKGLDVVIDRNGKEVLQYLTPREFTKLREQW